VRADDGMAGLVCERSLARHFKRGRSVLIENIAGAVLDRVNQFGRYAMRQVWQVNRLRNVTHGRTCVHGHGASLPEVVW
jgi:hypothetical protein